MMGWAFFAIKCNDMVLRVIFRNAIYNWCRGLKLWNNIRRGDKLWLIKRKSILSKIKSLRQLIMRIYEIGDFKRFRLSRRRDHGLMIHMMYQN